MHGESAERGRESPFCVQSTLIQGVGLCPRLEYLRHIRAAGSPRGRQRLPFCPNIPPDRTGKKHNTRPMKRPQEAVVFFVAIPIEIFILLCYTIHTCGCSSSVELRLPKPIRWVRLPSSAPEKALALASAFFNEINPLRDL